MDELGWRVCRSADLAPLVLGHYSRRHPVRPGVHLGGAGAPLYLLTRSGSAWVAVLQRGSRWPVVWRSWPSWWVSLFRRHPSDPLKASELVRRAWVWTWSVCQAPGYTAVDVRRVLSSTPGLCFLRAGWRYHCSTRPLERWRSLLVLKRGA